jgi:sugar O-acyltransferase (sialic acid O-acetyltransferase NeuD family)
MSESDPANGSNAPRTGQFVIAGASGYGCELVVACRAVGREPVCLLDDGQPDQARIAATGIELRGKIDEAGAWGWNFLVGIGYPEPRTGVTERLLALGLQPSAPVVHPSAVLMGAEPVPDGTVVFPNVTVSRGARLGAHVLVNYNATVGHDTVVGDFTTVSPGAQIGGECRIGAGVLIGSGAVVLQDVQIGDRAKVGSGAVVTRDVLADELVLGVPARPR